ncbi:hypothetical protein RsTz2092_09220 [Deferribacterales bacterium RsTz2092]|nr:hypothetical protein AGMMS49941_07090 [Deferribacterales bacterium]
MAKNDYKKLELTWAGKDAQTQPEPLAYPSPSTNSLYTTTTNTANPKGACGTFRENYLEHTQLTPSMNGTCSV